MPTRTPVAVGGDDGQDVLSFVVRGKEDQENDLQQWAPGGEGRLRLGDITVEARIVGGMAQLVAVLPDGSRQLLAQGST